jgi:hypothetical protein
MPRLIWSAFGAPPSGGGNALSVEAAIWFQCITSLAFVAVGGAAETLTVPTAAMSAPIATGTNAIERLRDILLVVIASGWVGRAMASSFVPPSTGGTNVTGPYMH